MGIYTVASPSRHMKAAKPTSEYYIIHWMLRVINIDTHTDSYCIESVIL